MSHSEATASAAAALRTTRRATGITIPVYFPPDADNRVGIELLDDNLAACTAAVDDPSAICLAVDGHDCGAEVAADLARRWGTSLALGPVNKGKLHAVRNGMKQLWPRPGLEWLAVLDADGDHFANELVNLARAGLHARAARGAEEVLVLGRRISRHRPMGFLRGELEELADRVLLDALAYHAAVSDRPLHLEQATALDEFPDFHSGFKLYSRGAAEATFLRAPQLCGVSEAAYYRHGCEAVMTVEALRAGAWLAVANRTTLNEQPVSQFGRLDRERLVADKIVWPCRRLGVPPHFLDQWLRNHVPRLLLTTLAPEGKRELVAIRQLIAEEYGLPPIAADELTSGPLFV